MMTTIQKWGNSLGVRIPRTLAEDVRVEAGCEVDVRIEKGSIVISPRRNRRPALRSLLQKITPENLHGEVDFGPPVGREVW